MSRLSSFVPFALVLLLTLFARECAAQSLLSLCYTLSSSLLSSPVYPWSVSVYGTLNVSAPLAGSGGGLVEVQSATLQRTAVYRGQTHNTAGLTNALAPANSYLANDNTLSLTAPYLYSTHSLAFVFASSVYSAYGNSSASVSVYNDTAFGLAEDNIPPNDGVLAAVQATFTLAPATAYTANVPCTQPSLPAPAAADLTALNTAVAYAFCYTFTGGPGDGTAGSTWTISVQGNLTTSAYSGTGEADGAGSVVIGIQAVRVYTDPNGVLSTSRISGLANSNWQRGLYASNVLYPTYPYFDTYGLYYTSDAPLLNVEVTASSPTLIVGQLIVDGYKIFDETVYDASSGAAYLTSVGAIDLTPASGGKLSTLQCAANAGSLLSYAFCYTLTSDSSSAQSFSSIAYGVVQASGPVIRQGRPALTMQSMTGVRLLSFNGATTTQNIVRLVFINGETDLTHAAILNDNLLFLDASSSQAPIDYFGFVYALSSNAVFASHTAPTTDINLSAGEGTWYEWPVLSGNGSETSAATFSFTAANNPTTFPCPATAPTLQPSTSMQFCYTAQSAQWSLIAQGTVMLYGAPISVGGRSALALQSANGIRTYYSASGIVNTVAITGVSADAFGAVNYTYNQLLYSSAPYVDAAGLLFTLAPSPVALTPSGPVSGDPVVNVVLLGDGSVAEQVEEAVRGSVNRTTVSLVLGQAASSCSVNTFGQSGGSSSSSGAGGSNGGSSSSSGVIVSGNGGGGSGLSHGAIAGIVVGSVVGAVLLATIVGFILLAASRSRKPANPPSTPQASGNYSQQQLETSSKAHANGLEMA